MLNLDNLRLVWEGMQAPLESIVALKCANRVLSVEEYFYKKGDNTPVPLDQFFTFPIKEFYIRGKELKFKVEDVANKDTITQSILEWIDHEFAEQVPVFNAAPETPPEASVPTLSGGVIDRVRKIVDEKINPGLAGHGGHMSVLDYADGVLTVEFGGGCQGCTQISVTVKDGVEQILKKEIPEIQKLIDKTDHTSGENPYFK